MRKQFFISIFLIVHFSVFAQNISGVVTDFESGEHLVSVLVRTNDPTIFQYTNARGEFVFNAESGNLKYLIFSLTGYKSDTVFLTEGINSLSVKLKSNTLLNQVEIISKTDALQFNKMSTINMQTITQKELGKAACCNLSESFETNPSVDVNYSDAATGARKIQMLGLDGVYTQIISENFPSIKGLANGLGLALVPGPWLHSIQITKGVGSVVNGYESISGAINLEYQKPDNSPSLYFNAYQNQQGRSEINLLKSVKFSDKWSYAVMGHYSKVYVKNDFNNDGFLDQPLSNQFNFFNRFRYQSQKIIWQGGLKITDEQKIGGSVGFDPHKDIFTSAYFGIKSSIRQYEVFNKIGIIFPSSPYRSMGLITSYKYFSLDYKNFHKQYNGQENIGYANFIYQDILGDTRKTYKLGLSFMSDSFDEKFLKANYKRIELVPGAFFELTYNPTNRFSLILGMRYDYHNLMGSIVTPRLHLKYDAPHNWQLRATAGTGQRMANIFVENASVMASARKVYFNDYLQTEKAFNTGLSILKSFSFFEKDGTWITDYYYTHFLRQSLADLDRDAQEVHIINSDNLSYSHAVQSELNYELYKNLELCLAYKFYDVKSVYNFRLQNKPFVPKNRAMLNVAYASRFDLWKFDFTAKYFGVSRIPSTAGNPHKYHGADSSHPFFLLNAQVTKTFKKFEVYVGVENLTNFMQHQPVIAADNPFSKFYDASMVWGPAMGRVIYAGLRLIIK